MVIASGYVKYSKQSLEIGRKVDLKEQVDLKEPTGDLISSYLDLQESNLLYGGPDASDRSLWALVPCGKIVSTIYIYNFTASNIC